MASLAWLPSRSKPRVYYVSLADFYPGNYPPSVKRNNHLILRPHRDGGFVTGENDEQSRDMCEARRHSP
ncbi:uncharacterized protein RAG0_00098 [Rhynchosporium agropyri]|uniref:Uncharacterized protein n=1 Tax=Rhynchosporium agropyri TaxID=914238 RepID=A0A1E1JRU3_9HELO|nr:uncharacterized protein RAG0_00098 [Rhynchosporium agropyri]